MNAEILDCGPTPACEPLTRTRPLGACRMGGRPLVEIQRERLLEAGLAPAAGQPDGLFVRGDAWLSTDSLAACAGRPGTWILRDAAGFALAWSGARDGGGSRAAEWQADPASFRIRYPWDLLRVNEQLLAGITGSRIEGTVHPAAAIDGLLVLGPRSRVLPGVYIEGTAVIGADCKIGPNCYLRGPVSVGDRCHIGLAVELKNAIVMNDSNIGHLSYCGDSILGEKVNFGAGTMCANFRHDGGHHRSLVEGVLVDTGLRKLGAIIGDGVHTGIHTAIYPGRKIWPGLSTRPGTVVQRDLMEEQPAKD